MSVQTVINFQEARDFSGKMNATYAFLWQNIRGLAKSLFLIAGPPVLLGGIFLSEMFSRMMNVAKSSSGPFSASPFGMEEYFQSAMFFWQILATMLFMLIGGVFTVSTTYGYLFAYRKKEGATVSLSDVWYYVRRLFWSNFGTMILYYIGLMIAVFVLLIPLGIVSFVLGLVSPILSTIAAIFYYIAIIFLMIYFSMVFIIRCYEGIGFFQAISRLFVLTKNKLWSTFAIGGINMYIQYVFAVIFMIPWYIYFLLTILHTTNQSPFDKPSFLNETVSNIFLMLYFLASVLFYALPLLALAFQYFNLVELREAKGLLTRIETFGQEQVKSVDDEHF